MVAIWNESTVTDAVKLARELRNTGLRVELYPQSDKIGKQFKYAAERRIRLVALVGDDERAKGEVSVKDMGTSEQRAIKKEQLITELKKLVNPGRDKS